MREGVFLFIFVFALLFIVAIGFANVQLGNINDELRELLNESQTKLNTDYVELAKSYQMCMNKYNDTNLLDELGSTAMYFDNLGYMSVKVEGRTHDEVQESCEHEWLHYRWNREHFEE